MNANINFTIRNNTHGHMQLRRVKRPVGRRYGQASPLPYGHKLIIKTPRGKPKAGRTTIPDPYASLRDRRYALLSPLTVLISAIAMFTGAGGFLFLI